MATRSKALKNSKSKNRSKNSLADDAKSRFGFLILFLSALFLIIANIMFYQKGSMIMGLDIGKSKDTFGWMMLLFSVFLSTSVLCIAVTMTSKKRRRKSTPF